MPLLKLLIEQPFFERLIIACIILNAITLGLETYPNVMNGFGQTLLVIDKIFIGIFLTELVLKLVVYGKSFFNEGWNWFDFIIILITLLPFLGLNGLGNVSAFRSLRLLRLLSVIPSFRKVLTGIGRALSSSIAVMCVLSIILYVYSVMSVKLFRDIHPEKFADLDTAFFTFFQIMTLDAWSDIVRPVMNEHAWAGLFFASFIIITVFILLSIIIGVASNAMQQVEQETNR